jgi:hypothetical protein
MSAATLSETTPAVGLPDIHVWMTPEEAAETLSTSLSNVDQQLDQGDMESRVNDEGELQVLICLPKREKVTTAPAAVERVNATPRASVGDTMLPLMQALRQTQGNDAARRAKRSARFAWATAATILFAAGGAVALSVTAAMKARTIADAATQKLDEAAMRRTNDDGTKAALVADKSALIADKATLAAAHEAMSKTNAELAAKLEALTSERDRLKSQLAQANDALHKTEQDLVVERNVEDQLLTAALANHAAKAGQQKNQVVADGSN